MRRLPFSTLFHFHPTGLSPALRRSSTKITFFWLKFFGSDVEVPTWPDWRSYLSRGPTSPQNQPSYSLVGQTAGKGFGAGGR